MPEYSGTKILIWFLVLPALLASAGAATFMYFFATHDEYPHALRSDTVSIVSMFVLFLMSMFAALIGFALSRKLRRRLQQ